MANDKQESLNRKEQLLRELDIPEYRHAFVEAHVKDTIAFQLRAIRTDDGLEQRDVARLLGSEKKQPMVSRYENPDYGRYSVATLLELARVLDRALIVRFAPFSELLEWDWSSTERILHPPVYRKDFRLSLLAARLRSAIEQNQADSGLSQPNRGDGASPRKIQYADMEAEDRGELVAAGGNYGAR